jgi:hypothetical protein
MQGARGAKRREPAPKCPVCSERVVSGEVVIFDHGDLVHVDCRHSRPVPRYLVTQEATPFV